MRKLFSMMTGLCSTMIVLAAIPLPALADPLTDAEFRRLHALLQPTGEELWRTIPWKTALLDAQRNAARDRKPIFIWAMDGHPLGCT